MTDAISGYASTNTDEILRRAMEESGDSDPTRIQAEAGKPLHFDATRSADVHRAGLRSDGAALGNAKDAAIDQARDKAMDEAGAVAERFAPALGAFGAIGGAVAGLGSLYKSAIEDAKREGETQRALGASDAGVVALAQTLDVEPGFRSFVAQAHAGSDNVAAAMAVKLGDADHAGTRAALQVRADRGLVDAAGYAKMAASATRPLYERARAKIAEASTAIDPGQKAKLSGEARELNATAAETQRRYLAPVMSKAQGDAAYGLGVQRAVFLAAQADMPAGSAHFEAAVAKASANVRPVSASSVTVQG
jgi:hypothetical protein